MFESNNYEKETTDRHCLNDYITVLAKKCSFKNECRCFMRFFFCVHMVTYLQMKMERE